MEEQEKRILFAANISHAMSHHMELVYPAMTMFIVRDLGAEINEVIEAGILLYLLYGCLALPWGMLADRIGSTKALGAGLILSGCGAFLTSQASDVGQLYYTLALVGLGVACVHPAAMAAITKGIAERGRALGVFGVWGSVGIVSAPFLGGIGGYYLGWRMVMVLSGIVALGAGIYTLCLDFSDHKAEDKAHTVKLNKRDAFTCFLWLLLAMTFAGINYRANIVTLPVYFEERASALLDSLQSFTWVFLSKGKSGDTVAATMLMSLAVLVGMFGQILGGRVADRHDLRWGYFYFFLVCLPALILMANSSGLGLFFAAALFLMFSLGMQPIENSLVARLTPARLRSTAYGLKFCLTFGFAALAVKLVTLCRDYGGTSSVYLALAVVQVLLLSSIGVLIYKSRGQDMRQYSKARQHPTPASEIPLAETA